MWLPGDNFFQDKTIQIMATVVPGIEEIAGQQIGEIVNLSSGCKIKKKLRGRVFFEATASALTKIKCCDNLYYSIDKFEISSTKAGLAGLQERLKKINLDSFAARGRKIHVSAARSGKHSFSRFDLASVALEALAQRRFFEKGDEKNHDLHFRLDAIDDAAYFSLKLTPAEYRFRGFKQFMPGAIRPSIANSLVWLSRPVKSDIFVDPFCGSGTIAAERAIYPHRKILGFDILEEAVDIARANVSVHAVIRQGDARRLPLKEYSVDAIVTNPPWDVQIQADDVVRLYDGFLNEARRVLKGTGSMILLTDKLDILGSCEILAQISLHGLHPYIVRV